MAGDKQFFYYMNKVQNEINADEIVGCFNPYERTDFKTGFCGVNPFKIENDIFFGLDVKSQITQLNFYGKQFLTNPSYINSSLFDTAWAYLSYYVIPKKFLTLFDYIPWSEDTVQDTIINDYGWEWPMTQHQAGVLVTAWHLFITIFILPWLDLQKMMPLEAIKFALAN